VRDRPAAITARTLVLLPPSPLPNKLYAAIDGTGVPMVPVETRSAEQQGRGRARHTRGYARRLLTQDKLDEKGYPVRDRDSSR